MEKLQYTSSGCLLLTHLVHSAVPGADQDCGKPFNHCLSLVQAQVSLVCKTGTTTTRSFNQQHLLRTFYSSYCIGNGGARWWTEGRGRTTRKQAGIVQSQSTTGQGYSAGVLSKRQDTNKQGDHKINKTKPSKPCSVVSSVVRELKWGPKAPRVKSARHRTRKTSQPACHSARTAQHCLKDIYWRTLPWAPATCLTTPLQESLIPCLFLLLHKLTLQWILVTWSFFFTKLTFRSFPLGLWTFLPKLTELR